MKRKGGRPPSTNPANASIRLRVTPEQKAEMQTRAKLMGKSLSAWLIHIALCDPRLVSVNGTELEIR